MNNMQKSLYFLPRVSREFPLHPPQWLFYPFFTLLKSLTGLPNCSLLETLTSPFMGKASRSLPEDNASPAPHKAPCPSVSSPIFLLPPVRMSSLKKPSPAPGTLHPSPFRPAGNRLHQCRLSLLQGPSICFISIQTGSVLSSHKSKEAKIKTKELPFTQKLPSLSNPPDSPGTQRNCPHILSLSPHFAFIRHLTLVQHLAPAFYETCCYRAHQKSHCYPNPTGPLRGCTHLFENPSSHGFCDSTLHFPGFPPAFLALSSQPALWALFLHLNVIGVSQGQDLALFTLHPSFSPWQCQTPQSPSCARDSQILISSRSLSSVLQIRLSSCLSALCYEMLCLRDISDLKSSKLNSDPPRPKSSVSSSSSFFHLSKWSFHPCSGSFQKTESHP